MNTDTQIITKTIDGVRRIEEWKSICGYEDLYEISSFGRVKSYPRGGTIKNARILKPVFNGDYYQCTLSKNNISVNKIIHILVATAFIANPENKSQVNHIDTVKLNNCKWNL